MSRFKSMNSRSCLVLIHISGGRTRTTKTWPCGLTTMTQFSFFNSCFVCVFFFLFYSPPHIPMFNCFLSKFSMKSPRTRFITSVMTISKTIFTVGYYKKIFHRKKCVRWGEQHTLNRTLGLLIFFYCARSLAGRAAPNRLLFCIIYNKLRVCLFRTLLAAAVVVVSDDNSNNFGWHHFNSVRKQMWWRRKKIESQMKIQCLLYFPQDPWHLVRLIRCPHNSSTVWTKISQE